MKKGDVNILACPVCKRPLELNILEEKSGDVIKGTLFCKVCDHNYVISDSIANLLPPDTTG